MNIYHTRSCTRFYNTNDNLADQVHSYTPVKGIIASTTVRASSPNEVQKKGGYMGQQYFMDITSQCRTDSGNVCLQTLHH